MNYLKYLLKFLTLTIILFTIPTTFSQELSNHQRDSLIQIWEEKSVNELFSVFRERNRVRDTIKMEILANTILEKAKSGASKEDYLTAYRSLSGVCMVKENYKLGIEYMNKAVPYLKECPNYYNKTSIYAIRGDLYKILGEYEKSIQDYLKAIEILQTEKKEDFNEAFQISLRNNIAIMKSIMADSRGAIDLYFKNLEILKNSTNPDVKRKYKNILGKILLGIAKAYSDLGDYKNGILYCNKVIEVANNNNNNNNNNTSRKSYGLMGLGNIYSLTGKYKLAIEKLNEAEILSKEGDYQKVFIYLYKARAFYFLKNYKYVLLELEEIEKLKKKRKFDFFLLQEAYALFARTYQAIGDIEKATYYFEEGLKVFKSNNERKSKIRKDISERYHLDKFTDEIESLSKKNSGLKKILYIIILLLIIGILLFFIRFKKTQKKNKEIFKKLLKKLNNSALSNTTSFSKKNITDNTAKELIKKLEAFEKNEEFLDNMTSLVILAKKLETNTTYLSKVINEQKNQTFSEYITHLRLQYVLTRLKEDKMFRALTIDTIAKEVGFNNVVSFTNAFKKKTGIYPSYFIKKLNNELQETTFV